MRQCWFCSQWFRNKQSVRAHLKGCKVYNSDARLSLISKTSKVPCDYCGKIFRSQADCTHHLLYCKSYWPYVCDRCGKKFKGKDNFFVHREKCVLESIKKLEQERFKKVYR